MQSFAAHPAPLHDMTTSVVGYVKSYVVQDGWRWVPSGLAAVLLDAKSAFTEIFWIVLILWATDLVIGFLRAWHSRKEELEWVKVFRSVLKLVVIAFAVIGMNAIEQMLRHTGLPLEGQLVLTTMLVIGSADAFSIMSNLTYFWPGLSGVADTLRETLKQVRFEVPPPPPDDHPQEPTEENDESK